MTATNYGCVDLQCVSAANFEERDEQHSQKPARASQHAPTHLPRRAVVRCRVAKRLAKQGSQGPLQYQYSINKNRTAPPELITTTRRTAEYRTGRACQSHEEPDLPWLAHVLLLYRMLTCRHQHISSLLPGWRGAAR